MQATIIDSSLAAVPTAHAIQRIAERGIPWRAIQETLRSPFLDRPSRRAPGHRRLLRPAIIGERWRWLTVVVTTGRRRVIVTAYTFDGRRREEASR